MSAEVRVSALDDQRLWGADGLSVERFRTMVQDSHVSFLIGAGTPSGFFERLGDIETALTELDKLAVPPDEKALVRASIQGYFFQRVVRPNLQLIPLHAAAAALVRSYARFFRTLNHVLLRRRSTVLGKQANVFTTNVDMTFEVALEQLGIEVIDGFSGKIRPRFDLGEFGSTRFRQTTRFERRSEIPVIDLYKLHGSVGWRVEADGSPGERIFYDHGLEGVAEVGEAYDAAEKDLISISSADGLDVSQLAAEASGKRLTDATGRFAERYETLAIVNPEKSKFATTVLNETYYELIRRFANELEKENSLLLVHGFSFRDEHIRDLVLRGARTNPTLQVIVFCYRRSDREAYEALLPEPEIKNDNVLFVTPFAPEEGAEELLLDLDRLRETYFAPLVSDPPSIADQVIQLDVRVGSEQTSDA